MTGIERLRQMAEDFRNVKAAEHCTFIVNTWHGRFIDDAIDDIADQISQEHSEYCFKMGYRAAEDAETIRELRALLAKTINGVQAQCEAFGVDVSGCKTTDDMLHAMSEELGKRLMPGGMERPAPKVFDADGAETHAEAPSEEGPR